MIKHRLASRKLLAIAAAGVALSVGLAACGGDSGDGNDPGSSGTTANVRVLLNAQPSTLDPIVGSRSNQVVWGTIIEPLVNTQEDLEPGKDGIITDWERTDPTSWTFTVREGIKFSNGEAADAAAVANTILLNRDSDTAILKSYFANVTSVEATDATHFVVKTKLPQYDIPNLMGTVYLLPPKYYKEKGSEGFSAAPIGTGPYLFDSSQAGRDIVVKQNPDYWGDKAQNKKITFTWSTEPSQRLALLQSQGADVALDLAPAAVDQAKSTGLNVTSTETAMKIIAFLQTDKAPLTDPTLREAIALAISRDEIVSGIFDGKAVADGGLLNVKPGTQPKESVQADPTKAKQLVGTLSSKSTIPIAYPAGQYTNIKEVAEAVGGSLEAAGLTVKYTPVDYGTLVQRVVGRQINGIYIFAGVPNVAVPDFFASGFIKSQSITANCPDPKTDAMVAKALEQDSVEQADAIYDELNTITVVQKHCYVPLYRQIYNFGTGSKVKGVGYNPLNAWDWSKTTIG
ncbi:MAG: ABC transporter substrate-binding protein [Nocardioidaceae bacterium]